MGLDMYLVKKTYVQNWDHMKPEQLHQITVLRGGKPTHIKPERIQYIIEQVGDWRKANAIHQWFIKNVQKGVDDCGEYYVDEENLKKLLTDCKEVLSSITLLNGVVHVGSQMTPETDGQMEPIFEDGKIIDDSDIAEQILPTQSGFFFGSTDYDEWYVKDLKDTVKIVEQVLKEITEGEFYYSSSW